MGSRVLGIMGVRVHKGVRVYRVLSVMGFRVEWSLGLLGFDGVRGHNGV